ncbi:MAG: hypothetical protein J0H43_09540 [Actinobacteria bacterium]|nr:hypothetical protein [Actinomycetota bacterium]
MSRRTAPNHPASTMSIPKEFWYPTPDHTNVSPAPAQRLSTRTRLMPLLALIGGYTSALASTAHIDAAASALLLLTFVALVGFGVGVGRFTVAAVRHRRSGGER